MFFFTEGIKEGCLWEHTWDIWQLLAVHAPSSPGCFGCVHHWELGKCVNINHFPFHCSFLTVSWPGLADTNIFTGLSFISSGLSLPWSFHAHPRNHHQGTSQDALTRICSCFLWLVSVAGLCVLMQSSCGSVCFLLQRGTGRNWSYHAPAYSPCLGFQFRIRSQLGIFGPAILFFHYFTGTIYTHHSTVFLSPFQCSLSPQISLIIVCWNETWSSCLFPSTCSQASRQSCCCFAPFVLLYGTWQLLGQSLVSLGSLWCQV